MTTHQPAALRIDTDGTVTALADATYETIRDAVGGWIEAAPTDSSLTLWVNEEGKIDRLPFNPLGHALWNEVDTYGCIPNGDCLPGHASSPAHPTTTATPPPCLTGCYHDSPSSPPRPSSSGSRQARIPGARRPAPVARLRYRAPVAPTSR